MRREYLRYGFILVLITCIFALLVSCGSSGDDESSTGSITLEVSLESIPADGVSSSAITAEVKDASGNPVVGGTSVTFSTTLGTFSNGSTTYTEKTPDDPEIDPDDPEIDPTGIVVVSLMAGTTPGVANVTVQCSGVTQSISIEFTYAGSGGGVPVGEGFSLSPEYLNISGLWIAGLEDIITAWVLDVNGNAVKDSTPIEFKTYNTGGLLDPSISATLGGFALSTLTSTPAPTPQQGFVSVTAETTGGPTTRVTSLAVTPTPYDYIMYAGTNGGGVYKSTDRGANWLNISRSSENPKQGQNWIRPYIKGHSAICVDTDDPDTVYVGTGYLGKGNVYRSLNGGTTWNSNSFEEWNGLCATTDAVLSVLCDGDDTPTDYPYVWIGTEGRGVLYAVDGENFQPSGGTVTTPVPGPGNTGNGTMSDPILYYSSQTETWTATCVVPADASATVPEFDGSGDGWMSNVATSLTTKTENWTVTYKGGANNVTGPGGMTATLPVLNGSGNGWMSAVTTSATTKPEDWTVTYWLHAGPVTIPAPGNTGDGTVENIVVKADVAEETETWTLLCTDITTPGSEVFSVTGSVSGLQTPATVGMPYTTGSGSLDFEITAGSTNDFAMNDSFTFDTFNYWRVSGTVSGVQANAYTGTLYTSDDSEVEFTIFASSVPFAHGDYFTFSIGGKGTVIDIEVKAAVTETWTLVCTDATVPETFSVTGSVSGVQAPAPVGKYECEAVAFEIISGSVPFEIDDQITFDTTTYWQVEGTVSRVQTKKATTGAYYSSDNGEVGFTISEGSVPFAIGDSFTFSTTGTSAPFWRVEGTVSGLQWRWAENNVPYTSDNYEVSFTIYEGTIPFADGDTFSFSVTANTLGHGRTVWDIVKVPDTHGSTAILYAAAATGVFKSVNGGRTWDEPGSFTGDSITTLTLHPTSTGAGNDIIYAGTLNAGVWVSTDSGAIWTQYSSEMEMGQSARIEDLLLDPMNDRLYAITFQGPPEQAVGNIYTHALNADGSMATGQWSKANTGLAGVGLHVMAADDPDNPGALFAGGEGINLYKATGSGLTTGAPAWQVSKSGLTNLIMARKPILFSGECSLDVSYWEYEGTWYFTVYVQDIHGNPPIAGSTFTARLGSSTFFDITYGDCYTHQGTFSDPTNPFTNNPYRFAFFSDPDDEDTDELTIEFTSPDTRTDDPNVPGCSGADQTLIYSF